MPSGGFLAVMCVVTVATVLLTRYLALFLVERSLKSLTEMCMGVVRTLLGQPADGDDGIQYESDVGSTSPLFETLPGWQYWGADTPDTQEWVDPRPIYGPPAPKEDE